MPGLRDMPSSAAITPEPHLNTLENSWEEHEHLMNPMFLQSPDEIDLPPLDPELLDHQRKRQVRRNDNIITKYQLHISFYITFHD